MSKESIIDSTRPNAGRIYDYYLGGHHNFEIDRQVADKITQILPFTPKAALLQRWCLRDIAQELTGKLGYEVIIDFASGLPTQDHIHQVVPPGTTVIYSDNDPTVVEYANQILQGVDNTHFFEADARNPAEFLNRPAVQHVLNGRRNVALLFWGVGGYLSDPDIDASLTYLHEWAGEKSCLVLNAQFASGNPDHPAIQQVLAIYKQMGSNVYLRSIDRYQELAHPWKVDNAGFVSLLQWHGFDQSLIGEDLSAVGETGVGYGGYLYKS